MPLLRRVRDAGVRIAIASSAKKDELDKYLGIACIADLVDVKTSSDDAEESKPAPDLFEVVLRKLGIAGVDGIAIGDRAYDTSAAGKAGIATIGVLCGGFIEASLREAGCSDLVPGPATLFARFEKILARELDKAMFANAAIKAGTAVKLLFDPARRNQPFIFSPSEAECAAR